MLTLLLRAYLVPFDEKISSPQPRPRTKRLYAAGALSTHSSPTSSTVSRFSLVWAVYDLPPFRGTKETLPL